MTNSLDSLLFKLRVADAGTGPATDTQKTAAEGAGGSAVNDAIARTIQALGQGSTKVASAEGGAPVGDLLKLANEVRAADMDAEAKHAHLLGTCYADGLVERLGLYQGLAEEQTKIASAEDEARYDALNKFANEYPAEFEKYAGQGYADVMAGQDKTAEEWDRAFLERTDETHQLAMAHYFDGYHKTLALPAGR